MKRGAQSARIEFQDTESMRPSNPHRFHHGPTPVGRIAQNRPRSLGRSPCLSGPTKPKVRLVAVTCEKHERLFTNLIVGGAFSCRDQIGQGPSHPATFWKRSWADPCRNCGRRSRMYLQAGRLVAECSQFTPLACPPNPLLRIREVGLSATVTPALLVPSR